jgi:RNA recognition motif-containing protein
MEDAIAMDIYVSNLPYNTDDTTLSSFFEEYGQVEFVKIILDPYTGRSEGFGFVTMNNENEANSAIKALDGTVVGNRTIRVNEARSRSRLGAPSGRFEYNTFGRF